MYRVCRSSSPFDMAPGFFRSHPLREKGNGILGLTLGKSSFGDRNPAGSSTIVLDNDPAKRRCRPVRVLHEQKNRIIAELAQECRFPVVLVTLREARVQQGLHLWEWHGLNRIRNR